MKSLTFTLNGVFLQDYCLKQYEIPEEEPMMGAEDMADYNNRINSKHKGLAEKMCEALLLDSLKDHGNLTKQEIVKLLWDLLPDQLEDKQKMNKIDYLLKRLRVSGIIKNQSKGNASIWMLGKF